ncbi:fimbrial protein [Salmonella enterica]|nr:fimbrial protein [Salmonella enterica]
MLLVAPTFAATTVTSEFVITNRKIETANFSSSDTTATFSDVGGGLYKIHDNFSDANIGDLKQYGNHQIGFKRSNSLFSVRMMGQKLGHSFFVKGKYANSSFLLTGNTGVSGFYNEPFKNDGCDEVNPVFVANGVTNVTYTIKSSNNMNGNCIGSTGDIGFNYSPPFVLTSSGISRDVYLDLGNLQKDKSYRDAPPDIYVGQNIYSGEIIKNRAGDGFRIYYTNKITITKNPYFESVTLPTGDNLFDVKTTGSDIHGSLVIPYVINGYFTPYNKINLNVTSLNGFRLKDLDSKNSIPYSLSTTIGGQKTYSLATQGAGNGGVTIDNLTNENYALQGRFNASFSIDKSLVNVGDYTDTLTAVFEIAL